MGGSGGYGRTRSSPEISVLLEQSHGATTERADSAAIEGVLSEKLKELNDHDYEAIGRHRNEIADKLNSAYDEVEAIQYGGSHSRHTDVSGISDVDVIASLGEFSATSMSSKEAIDTLADHLRSRFPRTQIKTGRMAVTVSFADGIEIQVLPAFRHGNDGYKIPDPHSTGWIETHPQRFAQRLTRTNELTGGKLVPVIKLIKYLCSKHNVPVTSYHIENLATAIFERGDGGMPPSAMVERFFGQAKSRCLEPMIDPSGQSRDVAGEISSAQRSQLAKHFGNLERKVSEANNQPTVDEWSRLLE